MLLRFAKNALLWIMGLTFVACATQPSGNQTLSKSLAPPDTSVIVQSADTLIGPKDLLAISVFGVKEFDGDYQVDFDGQLKMPLIGEVRAQGLSALELSDVLEEKLSESYLQSASVKVLIAQTSEQVLTVEGSVENPGLYPVQGKTTLLQAIALAGGPDQFADKSRVVVFRQVSGERLVAGFNLKEIRSGTAPDPEIFGNDIVVVDGSDFRRNYTEFLRSVPLIALFRPFG